MRRTARSLCVMVALALMGSLAGAQVDETDLTPDDRESVTLLGATRTVAGWDFEADEDRLFEIPEGWFRSVHDPASDPPSFRPGFPPFNLARVERTPWGGGYAMRVPTRGGSASVMVARGRLIAMPGSDYMLTARVRTSGLSRGAARVGLRFVDGSLEPIDGAGAMSVPVREERGWRTVRVMLEGQEEAAFIQLELQLAQPDVLTPGARRAHDVVVEDVAGSAWFDDVRLYQVPRIDFAARDDQNVVVAPDAVELVLGVQDFTGERLDAEATVYDVRGRAVARRVMISGGETGAGSSSSVRWSPDLPSYGWYRAVVRLRNETGLVGQRACDFVWLGAGPARDAEDRARFGVVLGEGGALGATDEVLDLMGGLKAGSAWLGVWETAPDEAGGFSTWDEETDERVRRLVERFVDQRGSVTFVLGHTPGGLADAARTDTDDVLGVLLDQTEGVLSTLRPLLERFGESASSWHVGPIGGRSSARLSDPTGAIAYAEEAFGRLVARPRLSTSWPVGVTRAPMGDGVTVVVPEWMVAEGVSALLHDRSGDVAVVFPMLREGVYGVDAGVRRLVRLAVEAWSLGAASLAIEKPWTRSLDGRGGAMPTPSYGVWRVLSEELSGRTPLATLEVGLGAHAIVADAGATGTGVIVAWNDWGRPGRAALRARLADGPVRVRDHFGNERTVDLVDGEHRIELGPTPVFISGIDTRLVLFRAGLRLEPMFLESRAQRHRAEIVMRNPWREPIRVALRFDEPETWEFGPRLVRTTVPGGGTVRVPVDCSLGVGETSGRREVIAEVALTTPDGDVPVQRMVLPVEVGMKDLRATPSYRYVLGADGSVRSVVVALLVENIGDRELALSAFAFAPGHAAQEALITSLTPGRSVVRRFEFTGEPALEGRRIRAGLREFNGNGRLNYWIDLR